MNKKGFTLLEAMISVGIFAIAGLICLQNFLLNLRNLKVVQETQTAVLLSQKKLAEMSLEPESVEAGEGSFAEPYETFRWQISFVEATEVDSEENREITEESTNLEKYSVACLTTIWNDGQVRLLVPIVKDKGLLNNK